MGVLPAFCQGEQFDLAAALADGFERVPDAVHQRVQTLRDDGPQRTWAYARPGDAVWQVLNVLAGHVFPLEMAGSEDPMRSILG